jgi:tetratricopeptide (TPR) repeat protein
MSCDAVIPEIAKGAESVMKTNRVNVKTALLLVPLVFLLAAIPPAARAQRDTDAVRAQDALEKTDEIIRGAKSAVEEGRSQKARLSLEMAAGLQAKAWNTYRGNGFGMALKLTAEAREEAWHAIALARLDRQYEQNSARVVEETRERLARLHDAMIENGVRDEQAMKLMEQARNLLEKSRVNTQQLRYQLALKLAGNARDVAQKAEERVRNTRVLKESTERRLALLERLMDRARERAEAPGQERAHNQIAIAEGQLKRSRALLDAGRYREAKQSMEQCEKTLRNSVRLMPPGPVGDRQGRVEEAYRLLERASEIASGNGEGADPKTHGILDRSRAMIGQAESALAAGRTAEGLELLARAREMLRETIRAESGEMTRETVMMRIERIETLREETRNLAENCPEPGIKNLMERAREHVRLARDHAENGRLEQAAAEIAIARNMYQRIGELCAR